MTAKAGMKCKKCRQMQTRHNAMPYNGSPIEVFRCEDGQVGVFERQVTDPTRRSISFGSEELDLLHTIVTGAQRGRDLRVVTRHRLFSLLAGKVTRMRAKSKEAADGDRR